MMIQFKPLTSTLLVLISLIAFNIELSTQTEAPKTDSISAKQALVEEPIFGRWCPPEFIDGGDPGYFKFLKENLRCPKDAAKGTVAVKFTISPEGEVVDPVIIRGLSPAADEEALRFVRLLKYKPLVGCQLWAPMKYNLPVKFSSDCIPHP